MVAKMDITEVKVRGTMDPEIKKLQVHGKEKLTGFADLPIWATKSAVKIKDCIHDDDGFTCSVWIDGDWNQFIELR